MTQKPETEIYCEEIDRLRYELRQAKWATMIFLLLWLWASFGYPIPHIAEAHALNDCSTTLPPLCSVGQKPICVCQDWNCFYLCVDLRP